MFPAENCVYLLVYTFITCNLVSERRLTNDKGAEDKHEKLDELDPPASHPLDAGSPQQVSKLLPSCWDGPIVASLPQPSWLATPCCAPTTSIIALAQILDRARRRAARAFKKGIKESITGMHTYCALKCFLFNCPISLRLPKQGMFTQKTELKRLPCYSWKGGGYCFGIDVD